MGAGRMGGTHAAQIAQISSAKVTAVCDIYSAACRFMQETCGAAVWSGASELADRDDVDRVLIAGPT